jgi:hypothetical protein
MRLSLFFLELKQALIKAHFKNHHYGFWVVNYGKKPKLPPPIQSTRGELAACCLLLAAAAAAAAAAASAPNDRIATSDGPWG